jgi:hypothetical protein
VKNIKNILAILIYPERPSSELLILYARPK